MIFISTKQAFSHCFGDTAVAATRQRWIDRLGEVAQVTGIAKGVGTDGEVGGLHSREDTGGNPRGGVRHPADSCRYNDNRLVFFIY